MQMADAQQEQESLQRDLHREMRETTQVRDQMSELQKRCNVLRTEVQHAQAAQAADQRTLEATRAEMSRLQAHCSEQQALKEALQQEIAVQSNDVSQQAADLGRVTV
jgi:chromosome segregation ATPase